MDDEEIDFQEFLNSEVLHEFVEKEFKFLATMVGAWNVMTDQQWRGFVTNGGLDPTEDGRGDFPANVGAFRGVYALLEDITDRSLGSLYSSRFDCEGRHKADAIKSAKFRERLAASKR